MVWVIEMESDEKYMRRALALAGRGHGKTSPNPMVGAVLVQRGEIIGEGWHRKAGRPHAEIEAIRDARLRGEPIAGATLYVTLEPCSTAGRTPPCTEAIIAGRIGRVVAAAGDPNPKHAGRAFSILQSKGIDVCRGVLEVEATRLNEAFNHWVVRGTPFVTVKAAMTLDGKIATADGHSKWITGEKARSYSMKLRRGSDAILMGVNTVLADDPRLTIRAASGRLHRSKFLKRFILDTYGRTPANARVVTDPYASLTTLVTGRTLTAKQAEKWGGAVRVLKLPSRNGKIHLESLLKKLGAEEIISLLVEGGGEVNASFIENGLAQRIAFFYAPKILGGKNSRPGVAGRGARTLSEIKNLRVVEWKKLGDDLLLTARIAEEKNRE